MKIIEPYFTGITSILGVFFIQAIWLTLSRLLTEKKLSPKKSHLVMELGSGLLMTFYSVYLIYMSATENYYYLYGNLRLIVILIPAIFISIRVSLISVTLTSLLRFLTVGFTPVAISYVIIFSLFLLIVSLIKMVVKGNQLQTLLFSFIFALPI